MVVWRGGYFTSWLFNSVIYMLQKDNLGVKINAVLTFFFSFVHKELCSAFSLIKCFGNKFEETKMPISTVTLMCI